MLQQVVDRLVIMGQQQSTASLGDICLDVLALSLDALAVWGLLSFLVSP